MLPEGQRKLVVMPQIDEVVEGESQSIVVEPLPGALAASPSNTLVVNSVFVCRVSSQSGTRWASPVRASGL